MAINNRDCAMVHLVREFAFRWSGLTKTALSSVLALLS